MKWRNIMRQNIKPEQQSVNRIPNPEDPGTPPWGYQPPRHPWGPWPWPEPGPYPPEPPSPHHDMMRLDERMGRIPNPEDPFPSSPYPGGRMPTGPWGPWPWPNPGPMPPEPPWPYWHNPGGGNGRTKGVSQRGGMMPDMPWGGRSEPPDVSFEMPFEKLKRMVAQIMAMHKEIQAFIDSLPDSLKYPGRSARDDTND